MTSEDYYYLLVLGAMVIGGSFVYYLDNILAHISKTMRRYGYQPLTLFNASFFMAFNILLLVMLTSLNDPPADFPYASTSATVVAIVLFVAMRIYVFSNFKAKTNTLIAVKSILTLDAITVILASVVLTINLYVPEVACLPFIILLFYRGSSWSLLFSRKKK
jgi:hypothetical protein